MLGEVDDELRDRAGHRCRSASRAARRCSAPNEGLEAVHADRRHRGAGAGRLQRHRRRGRRHVHLSRRRHVACRPAAACRRAATSSTPSSARSRSTRIKLDPADNLEEFRTARRGGPRLLPARMRDWLLSSGRTAARMLIVPGARLRRHRPGAGAPFLKHPKGIRDVEEWYISTVDPQGLRPGGVRAAVRDRANRTSRR